MAGYIHLDTPASDEGFDLPEIIVKRNNPDPETGNKKEKHRMLFTRMGRSKGYELPWEQPPKYRQDPFYWVRVDTSRLG